MKITERSLNQIAERFQETDISVGTQFYKLEVTKDERDELIKILNVYPKIIRGLEDFQTLCETEIKQDNSGNVRYVTLVGLLERIKSGSLNLR